LVLAAFATFMIVLLVVSLRCWRLEAAKPSAQAESRPERKAA